MFTMGGWRIGVVMSWEGGGRMGEGREIRIRITIKIRIKIKIRITMIYFAPFHLSPIQSLPPFLIRAPLDFLSPRRQERQDCEKGKRS